MPNQYDLTAGVVTTQQLSTSALAQLHRLAQTAGPEVQHALAQLVAAAQQQAHLHAQHGQVQNNLADLQAMLNRMLQPLGLHIKNWQDPAQALLQLRVIADDFEVQYRAMLLRERTLNQHAIVSATDVHGTITYVNDLFCEINGMAPHQLLGKNHRIIASGIHPRAFYTGMWEAISQGHTWHGEICNRSPVTGQTYWVAATIVPFLDANGLPKEYISVRTDITKRKKLEQELAHERSFLESITANLGKGVMVLDREERCTFLNPEAERLLGWTLAQLKGQPLVATLFHRGALHGSDVQQIALALVGYGVGLLGLVAIKVLAPGYFASQDMRTPVKIAVVVLVLTQGLNVVLVPYLQHAGLAWSIGLGALVNALWLLLGLLRRGAYQPSSGWGKYFAQVLLACSLLAALLLGLAQRWDWLALGQWQRAGIMAGCLLASAVVYFGCLVVTGVKIRSLLRR